MAVPLAPLNKILFLVIFIEFIYWANIASEYVPDILLLSITIPSGANVAKFVPVT